MASGTHNRDLQVLIVDDSAVYRKILKEVIGDIGGVQLMGTAPNGRLALDKIKLQPPDVVLLDVEMPEMNGLETLTAIRNTAPEISVIMVSGAGKNAADVTITALEKGAVDFVTKPDESSMSLNHRNLVERLTPILMSVTTQVSVARVRKRHEQISERLSAGPRTPYGPSTEPDPPTAPPTARSPVEIALPGRIEIVVIGISTGGPNALGTMIPCLPKDIGVPVLIVQHMPPVFTNSLARSLNEKARLPVTEGTNDELIEPNHIYIAPGGYHMVIRRRKKDSRPALGLNSNPPENSCRPAVDVLFRSVATVFGGNVLSVIMTGMGQDGLNGVKTLKQRGAYSITQDEATCTIYGMPLAVFRAGLSDESLPLSGLAKRIAAIVKRVNQ